MNSLPRPGLCDFNTFVPGAFPDVSEIRRGQPAPHDRTPRWEGHGPLAEHNYFPGFRISTAEGRLLLAHGTATSLIFESSCLGGRSGQSRVVGQFSPYWPAALLVRWGVARTLHIL